jgi:hypothetical protein
MLRRVAQGRVHVNIDHRWHDLLIDVSCSNHRPVSRFFWYRRKLPST